MRHLDSPASVLQCWNTSEASLVSQIPSEWFDLCYLNVINSPFLASRTLGLQSQRVSVQQCHCTLCKHSNPIPERWWSAEISGNVWPAQKVSSHAFACVTSMDMLPCSKRAPELFNSFVHVPGATWELAWNSRSMAPHYFSWFCNSTQHGQSYARRNKHCWILACSIGICNTVVP